MASAFSVIFFGLILLSCFTARVAAGAYEDAKAAFVRGDVATALRLLRPLADQGNADAQRALAILFITGRGVPRDDAEAVKWLRKAAAQGDAIAQYLLGQAHATRQG